MQQGNTGKQEEKATKDRDLEQEKITSRNEPDTAPDEFIAPNADTDQPMDGKGIVNDAVLGGEDHKNINLEKKKEQEKKKQ